MSDSPPPAKRARTRYDLIKTFEILVGKGPDHQRFTVYEDLFTHRSEFLRSKRSSHDLAKPITLDDVNVEVFSAYLHCVNWGAESLASLVQSRLDESEHYPHIQRSSARDIDDQSNGDDKKSDDEGVTFKYEPVEKFPIDLYLLADKLIDPIAVNLAVDELVSVVDMRNLRFTSGLISFVYESTTSGSALRRLVRDYVMGDEVDADNYLGTFDNDKLDHEFVREVLREVWAINRSNADKIISDVYYDKDLQPKNYHQGVDSTRASVSEEERSEPAVSEEKLSEPAVSKRKESSRKRGRPTNSGTVVLGRPLETNKWWSVSQETFDGASPSENHRYTSVANAMERGSVKVPACANCVRRAANGLEDLADCKAVAGGRCGRCLWGRVPVTDGCPRP